MPWGAWPRLTPRFLPDLDMKHRNARKQDRALSEAWEGRQLGVKSATETGFVHACATMVQHISGPLSQDRKNFDAGLRVRRVTASGVYPDQHLPRSRCARLHMDGFQIARSRACVLINRSFQLSFPRIWEQHGRAVQASSFPHLPSPCPVPMEHWSDANGLECTDWTVDEVAPTTVFQLLRGLGGDTAARGVAITTGAAARHFPRRRYPKEGPEGPRQTSR